MFWDKQEKHDVIIIGAGSSGIGAARTLEQNGIHPLILEARGRIGGRMCRQVFVQNLRNRAIDPQITSPDSELCIQLGANWIHGLNASFNPMFEAAEKLHLSLYQTSSDDEPGDDVLLFDRLASKTTIPREDYKAVMERYTWVRETMFSDRAMQEEQCSLLDAFNQTIEKSAAVFGECSSLHRRCMNWLFDRIQIDQGTPLSELQTSSFVSSDSDGAFGEALVVGGYFQIIEHLASEYSLNIAFNHVVRSITSLPDGVRVDCINGSSFFAKACLVTLPIGVLQSGSVEFLPKRPPAIERICSIRRPALMNLVWLWYPRQFWPDNFNFFGVARDESQQTEFSTFLVPPIYDQYGRRQAILMCQVAGPFARMVEGMSNQEVADLATAALRDMFGEEEGVVPEPIGCLHSAWASDPFAMCSWSTYKSSPVPHTVKEPVHSTHDEDVVDDSQVELESVFSSDSCNTSTTSDSSSSEEDSEDEEYCGDVEMPGYGLNVFYSGEACSSNYLGTVHGAYRSGMRSARRILKLLSQAPDSSSCGETSVDSPLPIGVAGLSMESFDFVHASMVSSGSWLPNPKLETPGIESAFATELPHFSIVTQR